MFCTYMQVYVFLYHIKISCILQLISICVGGACNATCVYCQSLHTEKQLINIHVVPNM